MFVSIFVVVAELGFLTGFVPLKSDNFLNEGYSDMLGTRSFNTLCKTVLPLNLSNKKN